MFKKVSKRVLGWFFRKKFMPGVPWRVKFSKIFKFFFFKIPKMHKIVPESIQACFERVLGQIFGKFYAQCSMEGRVFEIFLKNQKILKIQKCPKSFPKVSKPVLNMFWGKLFEKFLPSFPWNVESSTIFKKNIFKIPKLPKSVPKSIQTCFRVIFSNKFYAQCSMEGRVFENFPKFFFQNSKNAQNRSQNYPNVF